MLPDAPLAALAVFSASSWRWQGATPPGHAPQDKGHKNRPPSPHLLRREKRPEPVF